MKSPDEIPFAKRISKKNITFPKSFLFISIFLLLILVSLFIRFINFIPLSTLVKTEFPKFGRTLLGHFPYEEVSKNELKSISPNLQVHQDMYEYVLQMKNDAEEDGIYLTFLSGFRSKRLQHEIFYEIKSLRNQAAFQRAKVSAPPGYSEHSTGFAIDIGDAKFPQFNFEIEFETTDAFKWLKKNASKYHFVMSFPKNNLQNISYEPWHWRFEGSVKALQKFNDSNKLYMMSK